MMDRLRARQEWQFFAALPKADARLAVVWWAVLLINGIMPAGFAVAIGVVVGAAQEGRSLTGPLTLIGIVFVLMLVANPVQTAVSMNLGNKLSAWLNEALIHCCVDPPGIGHLEDADLTEDLITAREFDRGMTGPPMYLNLDFIATGLVGLVAGLASAVVLAGFAWWAPLVLVAAWGSTHWLLRESGVWKDRNTPEVRSAQRHADYAYRLAVDPEPAKELRIFGLAGWAVDASSPAQDLFDLSTGRPGSGNVRFDRPGGRGRGQRCLFGALGGAAWRPSSWTISCSSAQVALGVSLVAFGGLNWALDGASAPVAAVARLGTAMAPWGAEPRRSAGAPGPQMRSPSAVSPPAIPAPNGWSSRPGPGRPPAPHWPSSARTAPARPPGQAALPAVRPDAGAIGWTGSTCGQSTCGLGGTWSTAGSRTLLRLELSPRENVDPGWAGRNDAANARPWSTPGRRQARRHLETTPWPKG